MISLLAATLALSGQKAVVFRELIAKPGRWIQKPTSLKALHGHVVLLDFWAYSCVNCVRTFPYLKEWYRRYHKDGFEIVGIHRPEFDFERDPANVMAAVKRFGFNWPILSDPQRENWDLYGVFGWPTKILIDGEGHQTLFRVGEGNDLLFEQEIQKELRNLHPGIKLPHLMSPVRATDKPGAICRPVTAELYTSIKGLPLKRVCYTSADIGVKKFFSYPAHLGEDVAYLSGDWTPMKHFLVANGNGSNLKLRYMAKEVNAVFVSDHPVRVEIYQNGKPAAPADIGGDVHLVKGIPTVVANGPRMYSLLKNHAWTHGELELRVKEAGLQLYEFSFSTDCVNPVK